MGSQNDLHDLILFYPLSAPYLKEVLDESSWERWLGLKIRCAEEWENLDELARLRSCYVPSLPYKGWYFWFCCFSSFPMASISSAFSVFLSCPFPYGYLYCVASLTQKWGKIFKLLITGQSYKRTEVLLSILICFLYKKDSRSASVET